MEKEDNDESSSKNRSVSSNNNGKSVSTNNRQAKPKIIWANLSNTHYQVVKTECERIGYKFTESDTKPLLFWYDSGGQMEIASSLAPWQFYNHFPGIWSISRKVEMARNIERMSKNGMEEVYKFHPKTFLLPGQFNDLKNFMLNISKRTKRTFIIKPDAGSQGKGILLVQNPDQLEDYFESSVAQQYIPPYLIDGYKFDLRIYALITSVDPLRIYIHNEGMARFCTEKYVKPRANNLDQVYSHLTNYSLNKKNDHFQKAGEDEGSKRSLSSIYKNIEKNSGKENTEKLRNRIDEIICLTLGCVQPFLSNSYHTAISSNDGKSRCFEILGFDILIDKHLTPWLLEVNCMPSLTCDSDFDLELKTSVICGTLKIVNLNPNFKKMVTNRHKAETQKRISGATNIPIRSLFNPEKETENAKSTNWRQIYPNNKNITIMATMESVLMQAKETPVGAAVETVASRARKEAVLQQIRENEQKAKIEQMKSGGKMKRPPFSTDTIGNSTISGKDANGSSPMSKPKITTKIVQKPKQITKVRLQSPFSRDVNSCNNNRCGYLNKKNVSKDDERNSNINTNLFQSEPGIPINDLEERERVKNLQRQLIQARSIEIERRIWLMTGVPDQKKSKPGMTEGITTNRVKSERRPKPPLIGRQVVKPVLLCMNP